MIELLDPDRECSCRICLPDTDSPADQTGRHCPDDTVETVREFGWTSLGIAASDGVPGWAFTIGLWHTLGSPEVAMFGLNNPDMQHWLNALAKQIKGGRPLTSEFEQRHGILPGDFPVETRPVHSSWYPGLFGTALRFYNHRPPLPVVQVVWPDRHGRFPWEPEAGDSCKANQPWLWLPMVEHPDSLWKDLDAITPWPFRDTEVRTPVRTTARILDGAEPIRGVVRGVDGGWQFLDGLDTGGDDARTVCLHHLYARYPQIAACGHLPPGGEAWVGGDGHWHPKPGAGQASA